MFHVKPWMVIGLIALSACQTTNVTEDAPVSADVTPVVDQAWDEVRIGTYNNQDFAKLFTEIGGYTAVYSDPAVMMLQQDGQGARIILEEMPMGAPQARAPDAASWEPGCYWSLMMRAKNVPSIVEDAKALGWEPKTPIAYLEFGPSKLNVVVLTHQATGTQIQLYERLTTPLPEGYPDFERFGVPFNVMQMVSDRDATYRFFTEQLGYEPFYHGEPYVSEEPEIMPLGIPVELTTTVPYRASIVSPVKGMETGRFEMIEVMGANAGLTGRDFSATCTREAVGLTEVRYRVKFDSLKSLALLPEDRAAIPEGHSLVQTAPDGAMIAFLPQQ